MRAVEKSDRLNALHDDLLKGSLILSEWTTLLVQNAEIAYCAGASLSALLTACSAIESHLRYLGGERGGTLHGLISSSNLSPGIQAGLHDMRRIRNGWVHVRDPEDDGHLLADQQRTDAALDEHAYRAVELMLKVIYSEQGT